MKLNIIKRQNYIKKYFLKQQKKTQVNTDLVIMSVKLK
jgi:hypothetical protein